MELYHHKTDGGAEYLTDSFIECPNGEKEGTFTGANYIVRIDGDIEKDAELTICNTHQTGRLIAALKKCHGFIGENGPFDYQGDLLEEVEALLLEVE